MPMERKNLRVFEDAVSLLKDNWPTPLLKLKSETREGFEVWAKLEFYNPFSRSIKDRPVWLMLLRALEKNDFNSLYEATSGNVGIALAALSNFYGKRFRAYIPRTTPTTTEIILRVYGVEVVRTDFETIDWDFIETVEADAKRDGAVNLNQFKNDANFQSHYEYTGKELVEQLKSIGRKPTCLIAGIGTSGHIAALSMRLREAFGDVKIVGVQPRKGESIPGIKRIETKPKWLAHASPWKIIDVSLEEAVKGSIEVARKEGIFIGLSSGAVFKAFQKIKNILGHGVYVLIFPDDGFKYVEIFAKHLKINKRHSI
ncbi:MAG: PLP-dependent cysteine synthase family protein [Thermoproteales archaeon]|nr:PLP-dependent cysteine synthase family protein [Thermoproteales archaeon]